MFTRLATRTCAKGFASQTAKSLFAKQAPFARLLVLARQTPLVARSFCTPPTDKAPDTLADEETMEIYQGMKINSHAGRLAGHLFAMVEKDEEGDLEGCAESLLAVNDAINGDHLLKMYLEDSTNSTADKKQTLEDLYDALEEEPDFYMDWAAVDMMELLIETKDLEALADVTADFNRMVLDYHGEIDCIVTSAEPLTEEQSQEAYNYISGVAGEDKAVLMEEVVDPSLLGGITIHLGDQFQDLSVRSALIAAEAALRAQ